MGEALYYLLTAEMMDANEARRIGLVHEVLPPEALMPRAEQIAERIASNHPLAVRAIKKAVNIGLNVPFEISMRFNHELSVRGSAQRGRRRGTQGVSGEAPADLQRRVTIPLGC